MAKQRASKRRAEPTEAESLVKFRRFVDQKTENRVPYGVLLPRTEAEIEDERRLKRENEDWRIRDRRRRAKNKRSAAQSRKRKVADAEYARIVDKIRARQGISPRNLAAAVQIQLLAKGTEVSIPTVRSNLKRLGYL